MSLENSIDRLADAMELLADSISNMNNSSSKETPEEANASAAKRAEIIEQLKLLQVPFNPRQKTYTLEKMLADAQPREVETVAITGTTIVPVVETVNAAPPIVIQTPLATPPEAVTIKEEVAPVVVAPPVVPPKAVAATSGAAAKAMLLEYAKLNGRKKTVALLATFGATKISEVEAAGRLDEFVKAMGN